MFIFFFPFFEDYFVCFESMAYGNSIIRRVTFFIFFTTLLSIQIFKSRAQSIHFVGETLDVFSFFIYDGTCFGKGALGLGH